MHRGRCKLARVAEGNMLEVIVPRLWGRTGVQFEMRIESSECKAG